MSRCAATLLVYAINPSQKRSETYNRGEMGLALFTLFSCYARLSNTHTAWRKHLFSVDLLK